MSYITGVGLTSYGKHEGSSTLGLMSKAAELAIADAGLKRSDIDGVLCGYTTITPHIMFATVFADHSGLLRARCLALHARIRRRPRRPRRIRGADARSRNYASRRAVSGQDHRRR